MQPSQNTAAGVTTNLSLEKVNAQVAQDNKDLPGAIAAIQNAGTDEALQQVAAVSDLLGQTVTSIPASTQVLDIQTGAAATATAATDATTATSASAAATTTSSGKKNGKGNGNNNNNANNNANAANNGNNRGNNNKRRATVFFA